VDPVNRVGQVWIAQIGFERFPFVVLEKHGSFWLVQNLSRVGPSEHLGTIKGTQFGVEEGVFQQFENKDKGLQPGDLLTFSANILRERIA